LEHSNDLDQGNKNEFSGSISNNINDLMNKYKITGLSISVVKDNNIIWSNGFGYSDKENRQNATEHTKYLIGSMTKLFTGTAIMQLAEIGRIELDSPVTDYLTEFKIKSRSGSESIITVRNLLTHHSGLPCDNFDKFYNEFPDNTNNTFRKALDYINNNYSSYEPNYIWSYSNLGYSLLGMIIEKVSGQDYCEYIKENILKPLDMTESGTILDADMVSALAKTYANNKFEPEGFLRDLPAGCVISTASDMAKFVGMVLNYGKYNDNVISEKSIKEMLTCQNPAFSLDLGFKMGLSWMLEWSGYDYAGKVAWHDGSSEHYNGLTIVLPDQKLGIVLLSNSSAALPVFLRKVANIVLNEVLSQNGIVEPSDNDIDHAPIRQVDSKLIAGTYAGLNGLITIKNEKNALKINMSGLNLFLKPVYDDWFEPELKLFGKINIKLKQLSKIRVAVKIFDGEQFLAIEQTVENLKFKQLVARKLKDSMDNFAWVNYVGKYEAVDHKNTVTNEIVVGLKNGVIYINAVARKLGRLKIILDPISDDEAITVGMGRFSSETIKHMTENSFDCIELFGLKYKKCV